MINETHRLQLRLDNLRKEIESLKTELKETQKGRKNYEDAWFKQNHENVLLNDTNIKLKNENNRLKKMLALKIQDLNDPQSWGKYNISKEAIQSYAIPSGRKITVT